ncbi:MAG: hypothetical protein DHS20C18_08900 [Saprospiraceae bacterium]|nr:MAG: hypothetical protein DHS20C18_08900 [Saprospiraceae bacterium]
MEENNTKLEQIERFVTGVMEASEKVAFDQQIAGDEVLREEVMDYQNLLSGFSQIRENAFQTQIDTWNKDWVATDETEWIEAYVAGDLHPELLSRMEVRLEKNADLAAKVADHRRLMDGFSGIQEKTFAGKLQSWDKEQPKPATIRSLRPIFIRIAAAASVLLLIGIGFNWYAQENYSGSALVADFYQEPSTGTTLGGNTGEKSQIAQLFANAHREFTEGQYNAAIRNFDNLLVAITDSELEDSARNYYEQNALWTRSLALISQGEDLPRAKASLQAIAADPDNEYQKKATDLLKEMQSIFYRWAN